MEEGVLRLFKQRVIVKYLHCGSPGLLQHRAIFGKIGYVEVYCKAALYGALKVSRASHSHIRLCKLEAILCLAHKLYPLSALLAKFVTCHKNAVGALRASSNPAAQLVQLA